MKQRAKDKFNSNPQRKLARTLRVRINHALKGISKSDKTKTLLGCSLEFFRKYIESKFLPGMTWENYGRWHLGQPMKWHIDHIKCCDSFDLTNPDEQRKCFHYTNMQPLWADENLRKGNLTNF